MSAGVRPTLDRVRQILFDIVGPSVTDGPVLDLYSGSGAIGLEALSRGAPWAVFVESARPARKALDENRERLGAGGCSRVLGMSVLRAIPVLIREGLRFRWIFVDPPYGAPEVPDLLALLGREDLPLLETPGRIVLEARSSDPVPEQAGRLRRYRVRVAGGTALHFFEGESGQQDEEGRPS